MCHRAVLADPAILTIPTLAIAKADVVEMTDAAAEAETETVITTDVVTTDVTGEIKAMTSACEISCRNS
jgi:uncharacterized Rossmann fold enzyme